MKNKVLVLLIVSTSFAINASELDGNGFDESGVFGLAKKNYNYEQLGKCIDTFHIDTPNRQRCTVLHLAARYGADKNVQLLLDKRANTNVQDRYGATPLDYAFTGLQASNYNNGEYGNYYQDQVQPYVTIITALLEHDANPNLHGCGSTLLHHIAFLHSAQDPVYYETLKILMPQLVKHGLDWSITSNDGLTAYQIAKKYYHTKIVEIFESVGING